MGVGLGLALRPKPAAAHRLAAANPSGVTHIADASVSYAFYQTLVRPNQVDLYTLDVAAGDRIHVAINIPQLPHLTGFQVNVLLLGPGLPRLDPSLLPAGAAWTQLGVPTTHGLLLPDAATGGFHEHFTQTDYWNRQREDVTAPASGRYAVVVWHPTGATGKYVLATGYREVFGAADLLRFPGWWWRVRRYFGQFGGKA